MQVWNPDDWEAFSLHLLQTRHGPLNVQKIPAAHKGDFGLDYYCIKDAVAYQCYSVLEPIDISVRADRQKDKITRDLAKVVKNQTEIAKLFLGKPIRHWVLLAPLHDSKEVNLHCSKKTADMRKGGCSILDSNFEVSVHDTGNFPASAVAMGMSAIGNVRLAIPIPSDADLAAWQAGSLQLLANTTRKLSKRAQPSDLDETVADTMKAFLQATALLDALRDGAPDLHEKVMLAINSRTRRLKFVGPKTGQPPSEVLGGELDMMIDALKEAAPSLSDENAEQIAYGTIAEWIMRCPLDFADA